MSESIQKKISRNRKPRVHITYDVEIGDAIEKKEIPFVVGVLADLSGDNTPEIDYDDRDFVTVDRDNFNDFFGGKTGIKPKLKLDNIKTPLTNELSKINLNFTSINDFHPDHLLANILKSDDQSEIAENLRKLVEIKDLLSDFLENYEENSSVADALKEMIEATLNYHIPSDAKKS